MATRSLLSILAGGILAFTTTFAVVPSEAQNKLTVLNASSIQKLMPATVFYRGQVATTQLRNSGGVKFSDGYFVLTGLVDTSGYSSAVAAKYQAYFITEVPIHIGGSRLGAGAYGIGFIANNKFIVTDIGGHDVFTVDSATDSSLQRPRPLEVVAGSGNSFRLYDGRRYVIITR